MMKGEVYIQGIRYPWGRTILSRFPGSPNAYPLRSESMTRINMDKFSDDELVKQYGELVNKEAWDEMSLINKNFIQ